MSLESDILGLLKSEGYPVNEAVRDALADFLEAVEDEAEGADEDMDVEDRFED